MKKKQIIKIFLFGLILLVILLILSYIFIPKGNSEEMGMEEPRAHGILAEDDNTIDVIIEGDSISHTCIIPETLWKEYGYTSYAIGWPGKIMCEIEDNLNLYLETQTPDIVLLETNTFYSPNPIATTCIKQVYKYLPVIKYHDRWKNLNSKDFFGEINYEYKDKNKGYYPSKVVKPNEIGDYMTPTDQIEDISSINKWYFRRISQKCKEYNTELILISVPSPKNYNYARHNAIQKLANEENLEYIDLNLKEHNLNMDWHTDSRDEADHLNDYGAEKVTNYMKNYLKNKNKLTDHRNDDRFKNWF